MNEMTSLSEIKTTEIGAKSPESGSELRSAREYLNNQFKSPDTMNTADSFTTFDNNTRSDSIELHYDTPSEKTENEHTEGGKYSDVPPSENKEKHHTPAHSVTELKFEDGPVIKMDKEDHKLTASCGNSKEAQEYRAKQKELVSEGKFREAVQMDIDDIHDKFGAKYDEGISQMLKYVDKLEQEHKI